MVADPKKCKDVAKSLISGPDFSIDFAINRRIMCMEYNIFGMITKDTFRPFILFRRKKRRVSAAHPRPARPLPCVSVGQIFIPILNNSLSLAECQQVSP
jgi:hypothetical protein